MHEAYNQLFCLSIFVITGIVIGILFDIFRIFRKSFKTADWITYLQDIMFWILAGLIILFSIFQFNHGEIRAYVFLGIALGILLYMLTISKYVIKYSVIIIEWFKKLIYYPIRIIMNFFKKSLIMPTQNLVKQIWKNIYKKRNNMTKSGKKISKKEINLKEKRGIL